MGKLIGKKAKTHYQNNWHLIGGRLLGEKAWQLYDKSMAIEEAGFSINPRAVLSMEWTEKLKSNEKRYTDKEIDDLKLILKILNSSPFLVVRSSANGDSRGFGAYKSVFCKNNLNELITAINEVLDSENTPSAIAFRKDAGFNSGMAIIIEPMIGREYNCFLDPALLTN
ncbi:MAG: PEP/pyruvate-binding domain-containing protein [Candidatus Micrarchaeia archaeon]